MTNKTPNKKDNDITQSENLIMTSILYTGLCFQLIDFIDNSMKDKDEQAISLMSNFTANREFTYDDIKPISRLGTSLGMLTGIIFFIKKKEIKLSEETINHIKCFTNNKQCNFNNHYQIIRVIRNALAHWSESTNNNEHISVTDDNITFTSFDNKVFKVEINIPDGMHFFINDVMRLKNEFVRKLLNK